MKISCFVFCLKLYFYSYSLAYLFYEPEKMGGGWERGKQKVHQVTDVMIHPPIENIIFNSYKTLTKTASDEEKRYLRKMGISGYRKIVLDMIKKKTNPKADVLLCAVQTLQHVVDLTMAARKAWGKAKLTTVTKATDFMRVIVGNEDSEVTVGGGFYCQTCFTQPRNDFNWTVGKKCGVLSGWFCAHKGCPYDTKRMAGLVTFADKQEPEKSFVMNTRMPQGTTANLLAVMKLVNLIRNGECAFTAEDISKAGGVGKALKKLIGADNDRYFRSFGLLRAVAVEGYMHAPDLGEHHCPEFEICEGENEITLRAQDFGRPYIMYNVAQLFAGDEPAEAFDGAWRGIVQTVLSAWGIAEAVVIHPDLNEYTNCSKKTIKKLKTWTYIRATGCYDTDASDASSMMEASDSDKEWASKPFTEF